MAAAVPADPSKAKPPVRIHHHGNEASTVAIAAVTLRISCFMALLGCVLSLPAGYTAGSMALALLLCRGSN